MRRQFAATIVSVAAIAAAVFLYRILSSPSVAGKEGAKQTNVAIGSKAIAVLPFANLSADLGNGYFVSGMRDEILTCLAHLHGLVVRSRTSTHRYQSHPEDLGALSRALGVATVLEGRVQKENDV